MIDQEEAELRIEDLIFDVEYLRGEQRHLLKPQRDLDRERMLLRKQIRKTRDVREQLRNKELEFRKLKNLFEQKKRELKTHDLYSEVTHLRNLIDEKRAETAGMIRRYEELHKTLTSQYQRAYDVFMKWMPWIEEETKKAVSNYQRERLI